ncbi:oxygenase MpaB family protein [Falsiroseomonas sp. HC035]|uniref:oxygenase MpaB family protein n=1 Tax=Falsiroseomonas sp. HC035 TaxID=3390999 RepID=UPI003D324001
MIIPQDYVAGFALAGHHDPALAETYLRFTGKGDPLADAALASVESSVGRRWIELGIEGGGGALAEAPEQMRAFFAEAERVPDWYHPAATRAGHRAFHGNSEMLIGAFVGAVLIEGFATLISKSFAITGRVTDQGVRRLQQNNRHLVEIFMPGGLDRQGEGWKLSVRIRLMHARIRQLLSRSPEWEEPAWGVPLHAAHIGFATAAFSGLLLHRGRQLGLRFSAEEAESIMLVWRYAGHLMGVPPDLQAATEAEALHLVAIGRMCEPKPQMEAIMLANSLINSAPLVAGITEPAARRRLSRYVYRVSRALIGDEMADQLNYPKASTFGVLPFLRLRNGADRLLRKLLPGQEQRRRAGQFRRMLDLSFVERGMISYRLPGTLHAEKDRDAGRDAAG